MGRTKEEIILRSIESVPFFCSTAIEIWFSYIFLVAFLF